jgi:hypothetical protein
MRTCTARCTFGASAPQKEGDHPFRELGGRGSGGRGGGDFDEGSWPEILATQKEVFHA